MSAANKSGNDNAAPRRAAYQFAQHLEAERIGNPMRSMRREAVGSHALTWAARERAGHRYARALTHGRRPQAVPFCGVSVTIRCSERPPWTVLSVGGELDVVGAPDLRQAVVKTVADGCRGLILDISELDFIDSFGIGAVVAALKRLRQRGGELALVCPTPRIRRVFEICDLDRIIAMHDSIAGAAGSRPVPSAAPSVRVTP